MKMSSCRKATFNSSFSRLMNCPCCADVAGHDAVVNLASRIVSIAYAGSVVVAAEVHDALADDEGVRWKSLRTRQLKDIGRVQLWAARRVGDDFEREGVRERARRRRGAIRDKVTELVDRRAGDASDTEEEE